MIGGNDGCMIVRDHLEVFPLHSRWVAGRFQIPMEPSYAPGTATTQAQKTHSPMEKERDRENGKI